MATRPRKPDTALTEEERQEKEAAAQGGSMPVTEHFREMRNRLAVVLGAFILFNVVLITRAQVIVGFLTDMGAAYGYTFIYISPSELLLQQFKAALTTSFILCIPLLLYEVFAFMKPGLTKREKTGLLFGVGFFALGAFFAYKVVLPFMLQFLIKQGQGTDYVASVSIANYISFLLLIFTIFGFIFEMPLVSVILSRLGILTPKIMRKIRGGAIVAIFVVAAIITPPDIFSQIMVGVPMVALYELSIGLCILFQKRRKAAQEEEEE